MGIVYEARHRALGKRFALKALRHALAQDAEVAARFIQEARTAAAVSHPGLVEITDFGRLASGQVYFVMELLEGGSLAALLRREGPLPAGRGLAIVRQLAHAVKAAHDASIVHRDLKPDNIHVGRGDGGTDRVKVVDFGLAKVIGSSKLTRAGVVFGTPHYMSPEQATGDAVDHRADIYALGIVMYEMFTGKVPFEDDSYMGVLTKHLYMTPVPPSSLRPDLESLGAIEHVILRCLQKRPEARYDGLAALLAELDERVPPVSSPLRATPLPSVEARPPSREPAAAPHRRVRKLGPLLGVGVAFALGAFALLLSRPRGAQPESAPRVTPALTASAPRSVVSELAPAAVPSVVSEPSDAPRAEMTGAAPSAPARKPAAPAPAPTRDRSSKKTPSLKSGVRSPGIVDPWAR
jgi:serine/threonine-protein kinase